MVEVGLGSLYHFVVTVFQFLVVVAILSAGRLDWVRAGFSVVIGLSGLQTLSYFLSAYGIEILPFQGMGEINYLNLVDNVIMITVIFLLSQFPSPIGGNRWGRRAPWIWMVAVVLWVILRLLVFDYNPDTISVSDWARSLFNRMVWVASLGIFSMVLIPKWLSLHQGPLRGQTMWVGAGLGVNLMFIGAFTLVLGSQRIDSMFDFPLRFFQRSAAFLIGFFVVLSLVRLGVAASNSHRKDVLLFLGILLIGSALGVRMALNQQERALGEFAAQAFRPALLAIAMLQYDLFQIPNWGRKLWVPTTSFFVFAIAFLVSVIILSPSGIHEQRIEPLVAGSALLFLFIISWSAGPLFRGLKRHDSTSSRDPVLERYRLALERFDPADWESSTSLRRLREKWAISVEEHRALGSVLKSHLVIPTSSLKGPVRGDCIADRFVVLRIIAEGGQGRAILVRDDKIGKLVVLKQVLRPWEQDAKKREQRFRGEAEAGKNIDSPHVARVEGVVEDNMNLYLVREYIDGRPLNEVVEGAGPLAFDATIEILNDVLKGLEVLHNSGFCHTDLKPQNVIVTRAGNAVLIDYGEARHEDNIQTRTIVGIAGTVGWMAPEQIANQKADERSDIYAAGLLLIYMLTGKNSNPFLSDGEVDCLPRVPEKMRGALKRSLATDPGNRFSSAKAMRRELEELA